MLEIVDSVAEPGADDRCFAFTGRNAVVSLLRPPEEPWAREDLEADFGVPLVQVPIGIWGGKACFAVEVANDRIDPLRHIEGSLFTLLGRVSDGVFSAYGRAMQMLSWRNDHQFCGRCGQQTRLADSGKALACTSCEHSCYPRLSPCVIVAVTRGDRLLLAAAKGRRAAFYSTLAGFIEPGESAEEAVLREVREEVGIAVNNVRYFCSQPWPFPSQLMLGFYADYAGGDFVLAPNEIEDAGWYSRDELPPIPPRASISGQLIHGFFK
jgi:NAD+ diphosphatase